MADRTSNKKYKPMPKICDFISDISLKGQYPIIFHRNEDKDNSNVHRVLSLFSGCGGMDLGFEGHFIASRKSFADNDQRVEKSVSENWVMLKKTNFKEVFANDILPEAEVAWTTYMSRFGYDPSIYHCQSIVDLVKMQKAGANIFPKNIDVVLGGFPCQDFSVAGKRMGFNSQKDDYGKKREEDKPTEECRGKLYFWMKQVIDIVRPKIFIAENVKGLVNLGNVKEIIQKDFASADGNGYIVLNPQILHAGDFGVPESRERVFFIGIRRDALRSDALKALENKVMPDEYNPYPKPTHSCTVKDERLLPIVTTYDVLKDLKEPEETIDPSQSFYSKAKYLSNGSQGQTEIKLNGLGPTIRSEHHGNIEFRRLSAEHGGKHTDELNAGLLERRLTPRECAMIQTFPPDYKFVMKKKNGRGFSVSPSGAYRIIGNAVPPVLAFNIAMRIQSLWNKYFK
ncbi:DNA (cytosine-5-)-methyltransferase [Prevotella amnii]|uniref:Cytosine-specific methyltransferase n=1 Tax=Prevotella amnii TaxID=419005 RepID=A0A134BDQ7_9BACT|nr:DNA cytosine methyltransferase [Prevotella amnii]KXB78065.1 DNA (cytosine-5-)-methyltransferase [Prevotella amnii]